MRAFVALELPDQVKDHLQALRRDSRLDDLKWVNRDQLHLTLRFIGEIDARQVVAVKGALHAVQFESFSLTVRGVGQFPPKRPLRVLWVGVQESAPLTALAEKVETQIVSTGLPAADKPFSAHITLARARTAPSREGVEAFFDENADFALDPFTVDHFVLYFSVLSPQGPSYQPQLTVQASKSD